MRSEAREMAAISANGTRSPRKYSLGSRSIFSARFINRNFSRSGHARAMRYFSLNSGTTEQNIEVAVIEASIRNRTEWQAAGRILSDESNLGDALVSGIFRKDGRLFSGWSAMRTDCEGDIPSMMLNSRRRDARRLDPSTLCETATPPRFGWSNAPDLESSRACRMRYHRRLTVHNVAFLPGDAFQIHNNELSSVSLRWDYYTEY